MPITLIGLQALSVDTPITVSRALRAAHRADEVLGAEHVRGGGLAGEVLAGGHLLHRRRVEDDVDAFEHGAHTLSGSRTSPIQNSMSSVEVVVDDVVGGDAACW